MLSDVVSNVNDAIQDEINLTVNYKHNSFTALMNEIANDSKSSSLKNLRYPLICLVQPFNADASGKRIGVDVKCDIIIMTLTDATMSADDRETINYNAILRPIYAEFLQQLYAYPYIMFSGNQPKHSHMDIYHMGSNTGTKNGYIFPDKVDAIVIENLELHLEPQPCLVNSVYPLATLIYKNNVSGVRLVGTSGNIAVTFASASYIDLLKVGFATTPLYTINFPFDGTSDPIIVGQTYNKSVSAVANGQYTGYIQCDDGVTASRLNFFFEINNHVPLNYTLTSIFIYTIFQLTPLNPYLYRYYVNSVITDSNTIIQRNLISDNSDTNIINTFYDAGTSSSALTSVEIQEGLTGGYIHTKNTFTVDNVPLTNISYYKLQV
jgi:hypothetical protein